MVFTSALPTSAAVDDQNVGALFRRLGKRAGTEARVLEHGKSVTVRWANILYRCEPRHKSVGTGQTLTLFAAAPAEQTTGPVLQRRQALAQL
jgi:hypothetical protein